VNYTVLTFQATHYVLKAEKRLLEKGFKFDIIPTPKDISSDCGMSIRFDPDVTCEDLVKETLRLINIDFNIHEIWMK